MSKVMAYDPPFTVAVFTDADDLCLMLQAPRMGRRATSSSRPTAADLLDMVSACTLARP